MSTPGLDAVAGSASPYRDRPACIEHAGEKYSALPGETILETLLRHGVVIAHSCRKGSCQCCVQHLAKGEVATTRELDPSLARDRLVLPCVSIPIGDVMLAEASLAQRPMPAEIVAKTWLADDVIAVDLVAYGNFDFKVGQHVSLTRDDGLSRFYSIVSLPHDDYAFRIHVKRIPDGQMSNWICDELRAGERVHLRGPFGTLGQLDTIGAHEPLVFVATGTGAGVLHALVRAVLAKTHTGEITFYHGARDRAGLYLHEDLSALAGTATSFRYVPCVSAGEVNDGIAQGRVSAVIARENSLLAKPHVFLCGSPAMVEEMRGWALRSGVCRQRLHAEVFATSPAPIPRDSEKLAGLGAEPELWAALDEGPRLTRILQDFYVHVYKDEQLAPYFNGIPVERVVQKQYEFLAAIFRGDGGYFGLHPFNAHHWMVISDALFDHREKLFESVLVEHGLSESLIGRWLAVHELFRAEMVKSHARGMFISGNERPLRTHEVQHLDIATVCDGCGQEIPAGKPSRYHYRVGTLHCSTCARLISD